MVAWFIIAIATLVVFGFIAVNGVQTVAMTSDAAGRIETVRRLDGAVNALLARAASPDGNGIMYVPAGAVNPGGEGYGLPSDMGLMATTPFGKPIVYCPFGDTGVTGTAIDIPSANGTNYRVAVKAFEGRDYVVGGRPPFPAISNQPNLVGLLMAPRTKLSATPSCNQVIYNSGTRRFEAPDAIVRPLNREGGIDETRTVDARRLTFYVSPSGSGKGGSPADPASFAAALNYYRSHLPSFMTINMAPGNYGMGANDLAIPYQTNNFSSNLTINGIPEQVFVSMDSAGDIVIPGNLDLNGVVFPSNAQITVSSGNKLLMVNSAVGSISNQGHARFEGTNSITGSGARYILMVINGGEAFVTGRLQFFNPNGYGVRVYGGSDLVARSAVLSFNTANGGNFLTGIALEQTSRLDLANSDVQFPVGTTHGVYSQGGAISLYASTMSFGPGNSSRAITALEGSTVSLRLSQIGTGVPPAFGVYEIGSASLFGADTSIYATSKCWEGYLFSESESAAGSLSRVKPNMEITPLPAEPTPAQYENYSNQQGVNNLRAAMRVGNASEWRCNA